MKTGWRKSRRRKRRRSEEWIGSDRGSGRGRGRPCRAGKVVYEGVKTIQRVTGGEKKGPEGRVRYELEI